MPLPKYAIDDLRPLEQRVLEELQNAQGDWLSRADVSRLLGRGRIYPTDIAALDKLALLGLIEARETPRGAGATKWEYRIKVQE